MIRKGDEEIKKPLNIHFNWFIIVWNKTHGLAIAPKSKKWNLK